MAGERAFLGRGWAFPPTFLAGGRDVETAAADEDVRQSLEILLQTAPGERVMRRDFGCDLHGLLFEEVDQALVNRITRLVSDAILRYEPRIRLDRLDVDDSDAEAGLLLIRLEYTVRASNSRFNMVFPFYLNEATVPR